MLKPEARVQTALVAYIANKLPPVLPYVIKIDNEGKRTISGHVLAKRMGLCKGASDLFIAYPMSSYHGLFIEVKPEDFKLPKTIKYDSHLYHQLSFMEKVRDNGYYAKLIAGIDEGIDLIDCYFER